MTSLELDQAGGAPLAALPVGPDIELRTTPAAFLRQVFDQLEQPDWMTQGTLLAGVGNWPERIMVRDAVTMIGNVVRHGPNPCYHIDLFQARVPLFYGALETAIRCAPTLTDAFAVIADFASDRPGYLRYEVHERNGQLELHFVPAIHLGAARNWIIEVPVMAFASLVGRYLGRPSPQTQVQFGYPAPEHAEHLQGVLQCEVAFDAPVTAVVISDEVARKPNIGFDREGWLAARESCAAERSRQQFGDTLAGITDAFERLLATQSRAPRLHELAEHMSVSSRTLIRKLKDNGHTYSTFRDARLQPRMERLLRERSLTLEEVASRLGYADSSAFSRSFRRRFGKTPGQFRAGLAAG